MSIKAPSIVLFGGGKMGGAMLEGWLKAGTPAASISVFDLYPSDWLKGRAAATGFRLNPPLDSASAPDVLVLAIKPQMLDSAAADLAQIAGPQTLVISVIAGKTIANLKARLPRAEAFVRAMPNTPAAVGRGITGIAFSPSVSAPQKTVADDLLRSIGQIVHVEREEQIDAVTAVSGSGPAYVFHMVECLAKAGQAAGLPAAIAARLARATIEGAGELLFQDAATGPDQLRINVTSPGGTTAAALEVLMAQDGLQPLMTRAVAAAKRRAGELSG